MNKRYSFFFSSLLAVGLLHGCGSDSSSDQSKDDSNIGQPPQPNLIIDNDPSSCSKLAQDGSSVVVGSNQNGDPAAPEGASGYKLGNTVKYADKYMVVANTPLAVKAGCEILKAGGSAVDAAVAVQAVLGLVEPQSSTIAGSGFMMYYDAKTKTVTAYDGRETAPAAANEYYLIRQNLDDPDSPAPVPNARRSGRSIGVPGVMRLLEQAQQEHGKLKWNQLFDEAIHLADNGFRIPGRLADAIVSNANNLALDANAMKTYFYPDGTPRKVGETMTNQDYAKTLEALATQGAEAMYSGPIAQKIVEKAGQVVGDDSARTPITPSLMTLQDLSNYQVKKRTPICTTFRDRYYVCTMPPPSSGGIAVAQTLGILESFDMAKYPPKNPENEGGVPDVMGVHLVSEAERLAYADRDKYVADTDFVPLPARGIPSLLDRNYLKQRAALINPNQSMGVAQAGDFNSVAGVDRTVEHGTTQFTIVDAYGNVVSMTSTVESSMGSFHMVDGFLLSNQLTDFSAHPYDSNGALVANRVEGGKRPRSTMAPTLVFKGTTPDEFYMATGSPGGGTIIQYVVKTLIGALDWNLNAQQATSLVNFGATNSPNTNIDSSNDQLSLLELIEGLKAKGHGVSNTAQTSGIATIMRVEMDNQSKYAGGVDPRREGIVLGNGAL
ncbi:gamma-glutamyltransferase [Acinetobacter haemolyticus]|uniref:gamma-glutamyltransferase n=1 Tax=Acinetobacter haemolyticus TaxID=29430 RepID=UPI000F748A8C|nr:gamma-glutamyltransferase [Acinetobacter haemolyticus]RSN77025.1 gamma-glutamyltransferase [Acinetobacter haemolyticus]